MRNQAIFQEFAKKLNGRTVTDTLLDEITTLREQIEKLKAEKVIAAFESGIDLGADIAEQLAALAEQNEKLRTTLENTIIASNLDSTATIAVWRVKEALSLPNLASPVLNKYRAEGMRMAAEICEKWGGTFAPHVTVNACNATHKLDEAIRARAAELEKTNG